MSLKLERNILDPECFTFNWSSRSNLYSLRSSYDPGKTHKFSCAPHMSNEAWPYATPGPSHRWTSAYMYFHYDIIWNFIYLCLFFCFVTIILFSFFFFFFRYLLSGTFTTCIYPPCPPSPLSEFHIILLSLKFRNFFLI